MLVDDGVLVLDDGQWRAVGDLDRLAIPPTISALLAARLDRLSGDERRVAERASVVGRVFEPEAVAALSGETSAPNLELQLMALVRKELVRPDRSEVTGGDAFKFRHILIRDAAYNALPKRERAELHKLFADWLERAAGDRTAEFGEVVAFHLEAAVLYRKELGLDSGEQPLHAARRLFEAGSRAYERSDLSAAASLFRRGLELAPRGTDMRYSALPDAMRVMVSLGDIPAARALMTEAADVEDPSVAADAAVMGIFLEMVADPHFDAVRAGERADRATAVFEATGNELGLSRAWRLRAQLYSFAAKYADALQASEQALVHALRSNNRRQVVLSHGDIAGALTEGPVHAAAAEGRIRDLVAGELAEGEVGAARLVTLGWLQAIQGDIDSGRSSVVAARTADERSASVPDVMYDTYVAGRIEILAASWSRAHELLSEALATANELDDAWLRPAIYAAMAECQLRLGEDGAVETASRACAEASTNDIATRVLARLALGRALAAHGQVGDAIRTTREAVELISATDMIELRADALLAHAEVLRLSDNLTESRAAAERAFELYERKGHVVGTRAAADLLAH